MNDTTIITAHQKRDQLRSYADSIGVNEDYIAQLVETFYGKIRDHKELGPIFGNAIAADEWELHLARMKLFWSSVALHSGRYAGQPVPKHVNLLQGGPDVRPEHFNMWLSLFKKTLEETAPNPIVVQYFLERAERIAKSLELAMFGLPAIGTPR